jgi:hypothetical protein
MKDERCSICGKHSFILWVDTKENKRYCVECSQKRCEELEQANEVSK